MSKTVELTIRGTQWDAEGMQNSTEVSYRATFGEKDGSRFFFYEDAHTEGEMPDKCRLTVRENSLEMSRKGAQSTTMLFQVGAIHQAPYRTPFGTFPMEVRTEELDVEETPEGSRITVRYALFLEGDKLSHNQLDIEIKTEFINETEPSH